MWHGFVTFLYKASIVCAVGAHGSDLAATQHCIGAQKCNELNPWLGRFENPAVFGFAKMGVAAGSLLATNRVYEMDGKMKGIAITANLAQCVAYGAIAKHNMKVAGR